MIHWFADNEHMLTFGLFIYINGSTLHLFIYDWVGNLYYGRNTIADLNNKKAIKMFSELQHKLRKSDIGMLYNIHLSLSNCSGFLVIGDGENYEKQCIIPIIQLIHDRIYDKQLIHAMMFMSYSLPCL